MELNRCVFDLKLEMGVGVDVEMDMKVDMDTEMDMDTDNNQISELYRNFRGISRSAFNQ